MRLGMLIDLRTCIGCHACSVACKSELDVSLGVFRVPWGPWIGVYIVLTVNPAARVASSDHVDRFIFPLAELDGQAIDVGLTFSFADLAQSAGA